MVSAVAVAAVAAAVSRRAAICMRNDAASAQSDNCLGKHLSF